VLGIDFYLLIAYLIGTIAADIADAAHPDEFVHLSSTELFIASRVLLIVSHMVQLMTVLGVNIQDVSHLAFLHRKQSSKTYHFVRQAMMLMLAFNFAWLFIDVYEQSKNVESHSGIAYYVYLIAYPFIINFRLLICKFFFQKLRLARFYILNPPNTPIVDKYAFGTHREVSKPGICFRLCLCWKLLRVPYQAVGVTEAETVFEQLQKTKIHEQRSLSPDTPE